MRTPARILPTFALLALAGVGCSKDDKSGDSSAPACAGPVAVAGVDLASAPGHAVTLDGSASTVCDASSITYLWSIESVPVDSTVDNGDLDLTNPGAPSFTPDLPGTYVVSLSVTDSTGVASPVDDFAPPPGHAVQRIRRVAASPATHPLGHDRQPQRAQRTYTECTIGAVAQ